jgi:hypothetical protein
MFSGKESPRSMKSETFYLCVTQAQVYAKSGPQSRARAFLHPAADRKPQRNVILRVRSRSLIRARPAPALNEIGKFCLCVTQHNRSPSPLHRSRNAQLATHKGIGYY